MLTDIFAYRYLGHPIWEEYTEIQQRLLNQAFGIVKEVLPDYNPDYKEAEKNRSIWKSLHDQLARELGKDELSKRYYSFTKKDAPGQGVPVQGFWGWDYVCEQFVKAQIPKGHRDADQFIKERISFIELAMRHRGEMIEKLKTQLAQGFDATTALLHRVKSGGLRLPGDPDEGAKAWVRTQIKLFEKQVEELNERFQRARAPLSYHNGFIQVSMDEVIEQNIGKPFWALVSDPLWQNVDIDMKEAIDRRDSNDKDPALFAAKALESAIKIVSDENDFSRGNESGAAQYIDNLMSKANGHFIEVWEGDMLKDYFRKVRNNLGHGPGKEAMLELSIHQTDWAIETAMSWTRTLVRRM